MTTTPRGRSVLVVLLALLPLLVVAPASAHSALIGSTPESGATIRSLPENIELRFNEPLSDISPAVILRSDDETVAELEPEIDGPVLRAAAPQDLPDGEYTVTWRVVSGDGHPIDGVVPFTLAGEGETEPAAAAPTERTAPSAENESTAVALAIAAPVVLLLAAGLVWFLRRRRSSPSPTASKDTP